MNIQDNLFKRKVDIKSRYVIDYSSCPIMPNIPKNAFGYNGFINNPNLKRMSFVLSKDSIFTNDPPTWLTIRNLESSDPAIGLFLSDFNETNKNYKYKNLIKYYVMKDESEINPDGSEKDPEKWEKYAKWGMGLATLISVAVIVNKLPGRN